jgi:hypothetical protein
MQPPTTDVPPELAPGDDKRPAVGERCYVIGSYSVTAPVEKQVRVFGRGPAEEWLYDLSGSWEHGIATIGWREPGRTWRDAGAPDDTPGDPEIRMQCFDSRVITSSEVVARASRHVLKRYGWNLP